MHSNPHFKVSNAREKHPLKGSDEAAQNIKLVHIVNKHRKPMIGYRGRILGCPSSQMHSNPLSKHFKVSNAREKHPLKGSDEAVPKLESWSTS